MGKVGPQMATARIRSRQVILGEEVGGIIPEPEETEEDRIRYEAMLVRMEEDARLARESGVIVGGWKKAHLFAPSCQRPRTRFTQSSVIRAFTASVRRRSGYDAT